jgi:Xaa-Pro dipeptidase
MSSNPTSFQPSSSPFTLRQERLSTSIQQAGLAALALNPGPSLTYLTGLHFHLMERPVVALFTCDQPLALILPELEIAKIEALPFPKQAFPFGEDPAKWEDTFRQAFQTVVTGKGDISVEPTRLRFLELRLIEKASPGTRLVSAEEILAALRMKKDADELTAMRKAVEIAQTGLLAVLPLIKAGMTERQLSSELVFQLLRAGADVEFPFPPIVSGGANSANPHATPSDRPFQPGDLLVIDWGAFFYGYTSDLTRTFAIGEVEPEYTRIARIVMEANAAGRAAVRPGIPAGEVDLASRSVIEKAGYGSYFTHRTGHGLGMEGHEAPYIRAGNSLILEPGMTFTVEPGIYLPGRGGIRVEDDMVVTSHGGESLSDLEHELKMIG